MDAPEDQFIPLSELTLSTHRRRVWIRISRMWLSFNPNDNDWVIGLDSLLIDDQGGTMQARVPPIDIKKLEGRRVEGKVYALSEFTVRPSQKSYMTCGNCYMMYIRSQTVVNEIQENLKSIPLHHFDFVDFGDVPSRHSKNSLLTDVVGQIVHVGGIQQVRKNFAVYSEGSCLSHYMEILVANLMWRWLSKKALLLLSLQGCVFNFTLAEELIGVAAKDLVEEIIDDERYTVPFALSRICGLSHVFQVTITNRSFVITWILNNDELALLEHTGSVEMVVGGSGPLLKPGRMGLLAGF